ncbi:hypothetical protein OSTOST_11824, partial [Ostertagia ostertagi]
MLFMCLLWKNQRRYNRIVIEPTRNNDSTVQYTLSIRFQLNENIRSMKLLQNLVFTGTVSNFVCFVFLAASHIDFLHFYSDVVAHYFDAALNLYIAMMILLIDNLTNIDSLNYTVLSYIAIMEAVILFIELLVYVFIIHIAFHLPFHWNLRVIITVVLSQYYLPLTTRLVTLAIQMHVIPCEDDERMEKSDQEKQIKGAASTPRQNL